MGPEAAKEEWPELGAASLAAGEAISHIGARPKTNLKEFLARL